MRKVVWLAALAVVTAGTGVRAETQPVDFMRCDGYGAPTRGATA